MSKFDSVRRERLLTLFETGASVTDAAAASGISRQTVSEWLARGRRQPDSEAGEFAARFDALAVQRGEGDPDEVPPDHPAAWVEQGDPFVGLSPVELAMLDAEQRDRALALTVAEQAAAE